MQLEQADKWSGVLVGACRSLVGDKQNNVTNQRLRPVFTSLAGLAGHLQPTSQRIFVFFQWVITCRSCRSYGELRDLQARSPRRGQKDVCPSPNRNYEYLTGDYENGARRCTVTTHTPAALAPLFATGTGRSAVRCLAAGHWHVPRANPVGKSGCRTGAAMSMAAERPMAMTGTSRAGLTVTRRASRRS